MAGVAVVVAACGWWAVGGWLMLVGQGGVLRMCSVQAVAPRVHPVSKPMMPYRISTHGWWFLWWCRPGSFGLR